MNSRVVKAQLALSQERDWPTGLIVEGHPREIGRQLHGLTGVAVGFESAVP
jgi:hypothetical protein